MSWLNVIQSPQTGADTSALSLSPGPTIDQLPAGAWEGTGSALGSGAMRGLARAGEAAGLAGAVPFVLYGAVTGDTDPQDAYFADVIGTTRNAIDYWAPDAETSGRAAQIVGSLAEGIAPLLAGPEALIGAASLSAGADLSDEGASAAGAVLGSTVRGATTAIGLKLPATLGKTLTQRVAAGVAINVAAGAAGRAAEGSALAVTGDQPQADARFAELRDPTTYAIDALLGAAFGVAGHITAPRVTPAGADALLAANNSQHLSERTAPGEPADPRSSAIHQQGIADALELLGRGEPVRVRPDVADAEFLGGAEKVAELERIQQEVADLTAAYDRVLAEPFGGADDPIVTITPEAIDAVAVSRGGWKGLGDLEIRGSGFGLVKFIWRHGERSQKAADAQVTRDDILAFPEVIRQFEPVPAEGESGRTWRVELPGAEGKARTVVFADRRFDGEDTARVVSVHIQEPGKPGSDRPLSKQIGRPKSPGKWGNTRSGDTDPALLQQDGRGRPTGQSVSQGSQDGAGDPLTGPVRDAVATAPDALIDAGTDDSGAPVYRKASEVLAEIDAEFAAARTESLAFEVAANCYIGSAQ